MDERQLIEILDNKLQELSKLQELNKIQELKILTENIHDKIDNMSEDVSKIKEVVYNPDKGLYARIRTIEGWKGNVNKVMWIIVTCLVGLIGSSVFKYFFFSSN